jgi:rhodanese-related sulfurtransferase
MTTHLTDTVTRDEILQRLHDPTATIVNVLPRDAFLAARIPGSISLPLEEVAERARTVLPDQNADIIIYCGSPT